MARTTARAATAIAVALASVVLVTAPVEASAYRFWTYWQAAPASSTWAFANQGPGTTVPGDGSVEGWAFALSSEGGSREEQPQPLPDFGALCTGMASADGFKRVGLVVDPGPASIAPGGEVPIAPVAICVEIEDDATGYDVLRSALDVRTENGLVCGIGGYPSGECAPVLSDAEVLALKGVDHGALEDGPRVDTPGSVVNSATSADAAVVGTDGAAETEAGSGSPLASLTVVALLALGALSFLWLRRRRQR